MLGICWYFIIDLSLFVPATDGHGTLSRNQGAALVTTRNAPCQTISLQRRSLLSYSREDQG